MTVPSQAATPGVGAYSASAHVSRPATIAKRPRRPVHTQGTRARRSALAHWLRVYREERARDAALMAKGNRGVLRMTEAQYYAKWGHGDTELRRKAETAARLQKERRERNG